MCNGAMAGCRSQSVDSDGRGAGEYGRRLARGRDDQQVFLRGAGYADLWCISDRFMSSLFRVRVQPYFLPVEPRTPFVSGLGFMSESVSTWRGERKTWTGNGSGFLSFP